MRLFVWKDPLSSPNAKAVEEDEVMEDPEGLDSLKHLSLTSIQFYQCGLWWMLSVFSHLSSSSLSLLITVSCRSLGLLGDI